MKVNILAFGVVKDLVGGSIFGVEVPHDCTVNSLTDRLKEVYPAFVALSSFTVAINGEYALPDTVIKSGDEVAIIPPVSGG